MSSYTPNHQQLAIAILNWCRNHQEARSRTGPQGSSSATLSDRFNQARPRPSPRPQGSTPTLSDRFSSARSRPNPGLPGSRPTLSDRFNAARTGPNPGQSAPAQRGSNQTGEGHSEREYVVNADITLREVGNAGGQEQHFFHYYTNRILIVNLHGNPQIYWRTITTDHDLSGREGALLGTESFPPGTVGYGVHASISLIRFVFGDFGQARIGAFFNRPDVQRLLAMPDTVDNNRRVAEMEYRYWQNLRNNSPFLSEDWAGGKLGYQFNPSFRTYFPMVVTGPHRRAYDYVRDEVVDPITGHITSGINSVREFATRRLQQLRERFPNL